MPSLSTLLVSCLLASPATGFLAPPASRALRPVAKAATRQQDEHGNHNGKGAARAFNQAAGHLLAAALAAGMLATPAFAVSEVTSEVGIKYKLPPKAQTKDSCKFVSSSMGQANGARDSQPDFRGCNMAGQSAAGFDLSGLIGGEADFSKANFKDAQLSKGFLSESKFDGADFSNGIVDRCSFEGSSLKGAIFTNAVLTSTSFKGADLTDADFTDAYVGDFDKKRLCKNPTLAGTNPTTKQDTRFSAGCIE